MADPEVMPQGQYLGAPCKRGHIGRRYIKTRNCVDCDNERHRRLRAEKPGIHRDRNARYVAKHREAFLARKRMLAKKNPEKWAVYCRTRRARLAASAGQHSLTDIRGIFKAQSGKCAYCRSKLKKYEVDHIVPLARGGTNSPQNLQLLCMPCNRRKGAKHPIDFARELGRLI